MKRSAKADSDNAQNVTTAGAKPIQRTSKGARKRARTSRKLTRRMADAGSGIRDTEEARALLEDQLSSLYWWVFNAFKMKGFIRAKGLDELHHPTVPGDESHTEQGDLADDHVSRETLTV
jgi:hypothetical protein